MDIRRSQVICLFIDNYHDLRKHLRLGAYSKALRLSSLILSLKGIRIEIEEFRKSLDYIKRHTQWYSPFRSCMAPAAAFAITPEKTFYKAFNRLAFCCKALKIAGFRASSRLVPASMALYAASAEGSERLLASRSYSVYKSMKRWHTARTGKELFAPAVFMACSELWGKEIISHVARVSRRLHIRDASQARGLHFLYQILAYGADPLEETAVRCAEIFPILEKMNFRSPSLFYGTMGFLALSDHDSNRTVLDAMDTMSLLKLGKSFPGFEKEQAMLTASAIVAANRLQLMAEPSQSASISPVVSDPASSTFSVIRAQAASIPSIISALASACLL
ncbi:MAG: DUF4003 family protein [Clostridiaceae bacterium]|jgi:hypothetical protein|nr:DUF4003 family protein [Clostridiaceae bacterium]